jgi:membrane-bound ClpP family serine protease
VEVIAAIVPIGDMVEQISQSPVPVILVLAAPGLDSMDRALSLAAIGTLAIRLAPDRRIGALDLADGAAIEDIVAAACFLAEAASTTGQILRIGPAS